MLFRSSSCSSSASRPSNGVLSSGTPFPALSTSNRLSPLETPGLELGALVCSPSSRSAITLGVPPSRKVLESSELGGRLMRELEGVGDGDRDMAIGDRRGGVRRRGFEVSGWASLCVVLAWDLAGLDRQGTSNNLVPAELAPSVRRLRRGFRQLRSCVACASSLLLIPDD